MLIHLCFVLSEEEDEVLELDGVKRYDSNPPFMRVTYPGTIAHHLHSSVRNELFFTYEPRPEGGGKQQKPLEVGGRRILLGLFSRFLCTLDSAQISRDDVPA